MSAAEKLDFILDEIADRVVAKLRDSAATSPQLADYVDQGTCGFDSRTFIRAARAQAFPASKVGRRWIAKRVDVEFWIDSRRPGFVKTKNDTDLTDLRKKLRRAS